MSKIALFSLLALTKFGGAMVYTAHLMQSLRAFGHEPMLFRIGKRMGKELKPYTNGEHYQDITIDGARAVAQGTPSLITYVTPWSEYREAAIALVQAGARVVLHDSADMADEYLEVLRAEETHVVCIRRTGAEFLQSKGLRATYIPHPYIRAWEANAIGGAARAGAVSATRIDWRKRTEIICEANTLLHAQKRIQMYGALNRLFAYGTLDKKFPGWRVDYHGTFPPDADAAARIMSRATAAVDLTEIAGGWDGGGTQYSFLEAWDAGTPLIVKRTWIKNKPGDAVREGETAMAVAGAGELAGYVNSPFNAQVVKGGFAELKKHTPAQVIPHYAQILGL